MLGTHSKPERRRSGSSDVSQTMASACGSLRQRQILPLAARYECGGCLSMGVHTSLHTQALPVMRNTDWYSVRAITAAGRYTTHFTQQAVAARRDLTLAGGQCGASIAPGGSSGSGKPVGPLCCGILLFMAAPSSAVLHAKSRARKVSAVARAAWGRARQKGSRGGDEDAGGLEDLWAEILSHGHR